MNQTKLTTEEGYVIKYSDILKPSNTDCELYTYENEQDAKEIERIATRIILTCKRLEKKTGKLGNLIRALSLKPFGTLNELRVNLQLKYPSVRMKLLMMKFPNVRIDCMLMLAETD